MRDNEKKNYIPGSLRGRYLLSAIIFIGVIIVGAWWSSYHAYSVQNNSISNILVKNQSHGVTKRIRLLLWEANHSLQSYMVAPEQNLQNKIDSSIRRARQQIVYLHKIRIAGDYNWQESIDILNQKINSLSKDLSHLMEIRNDPERLHPAMKTMNDIMLSASNTFTTAVTLALDEIEIDQYGENYKLYKLLDRIRDNWNKMIGAFRVFVANRFGAFSTTEQGILAQAQNVEIFFNEIKADINHLERQAATIKLDLQGYESLKTMKSSSDKWFTAYQTVRKSYQSSEWRADVPFLQKRIQPVLGSIWRELDEIDLIIEASSDVHTAKISTIAGDISNILWLFSLFAFFVTVAGYINLQSNVLTPINKLSRALNNEAHGLTNEGLKSEDQATEIKELHQAFVLMKDKVQERQSVLRLKALHDPLTDLPNRILMEDRLQQALTSANREKSSAAVMLIDLNKFKEINDSLGHHAGDIILQDTSKRLLSVLRDTGTVARIGGDEFAIVIPEVNKPQVVLILQRIKQAFKNTCTIGEKNVEIKMSIGVAIYPEHGNDSAELLRNADSAMYLAKKAGQTVQYYQSRKIGNT